MSKKPRRKEEEEKENNDRWMLTYSDMITLLLALFIILYSFSNTDAEKYKAIAEQFGNAFHVSGKLGKGSGGDSSGLGDGSGTGYDESGDYFQNPDSDITDVSSNPDSGNGNGDGSGSMQNPLDEIYTVLTKYVNENNLQDEITLTNTSTYVQIRIEGLLMFYPDSPKMLDSSKPIMNKIGDALKEVYGRVDQITISGHTADVGEHNKQTDAFSWYLSINRADTVRQCLVEDGLNEGKLSLQGYAHYLPIAPNDTEENRAKNRRAEITVYKHETAVSGQTSKAASSSQVTQTTQNEQQDQAAQNNQEDQAVEANQADQTDQQN